MFLFLAKRISFTQRTGPGVEDSTSKKATVTHPQKQKGMKASASSINLTTRNHVMPAAPARKQTFDVSELLRGDYEHFEQIFQIFAHESSPTLAHE